MREDALGVVICSLAGAIVAASPEASDVLPGARLAAGTSLADGFGAFPALLAWSSRALAADGANPAAAAAAAEGEVLEVAEGPAVRVRASRLVASPADETVALLITRVPRVAAFDVALPQDVARKTWHDIQNQLGGLKLYATFLKKKLGGADDQLRDTAEKIVLGVDAVSQSIVRARRGEEEVSEKS